MQSTGDTYDSAPAHADPPACLVNMQHNPSPVASAMRPQHGMAHASALAVANAVANAAAAAAAVRATYDNSSRVLPPGSCWGAQLKGDLRECTAGFLAGRGHLKNKFCPRCRLPFVKATVHEIDVLVGLHTAVFVVCGTLYPALPTRSVVCSLGIDVPAYRVRAWTPELNLQLANDHREVHRLLRFESICEDDDT